MAKNRELKGPDVDPKHQVEKAFSDMKSALEKKIREQLGPGFVDEFVSRIEGALARVPKLYEVRDLVTREVADIIRDFERSLDARLKAVVAENTDRMWGDFINKKIEAKLHDPALVIEITKKVKELL